MSDVSGFDAHSAASADDLFDADAYIREGNRKPFRFRFDGDVYELAWAPDIRAIAAIKEGELLQALEIMLGEAQWDRIVSTEQVLDVFTLKEILERYAGHAGVDLPNLPRSTPSLSNTRPPLKPTYSGSITPR